MSDDLTAIIIVAIAVLGPIWLTFQFVNRRARSSRLSAQDAQAVAQLHAVAARMEARMAAVENILDESAPAWRAEQQRR